MKIKLIDYGYEKAPFRAYDNDAGADVHAMKDVVLWPMSTTKIPLGFGLELPDGLSAFIFPRSGLSSNHGIVCELPPIDSGYRGEVHAIVTNNTDAPFQVKKGDRIGQLVIIPIIIADFVTERGNERGTGAFESTGRN